MTARTRVAGLGGIGLALLAAGLLLLPAAVSGQTAQYAAQLNGASEVPATNSTATGTFTATLNEAAKTLQWSLNVPAITNATAAHIHAGAAGANGGVVVTLFSSATPAGSISTSGTAGPNDLAGSFAGNWDGFVAALKSSGLYINVHTSANPNGEIRGQVQAAAGQASPTATSAATSTATAMATAVATASPSAPKTGQAGLVDDSSNSGAAILFVAITVAVVAGGRLLTSRDR